MPFLRAALEWMHNAGPLILARAELPGHLLTAPADQLFTKIKWLITYDQDLRDAANAETFEKTVFIGMLLAAHTREPNGDLDLLGYATARLISAGRNQRARDLAEEALARTGDSPERRRVAWSIFADIYNRTHNAIASLIGLGCAFAGDVVLDSEQLWHEEYLLARILRDLHFVEQADSVLNHLRQLTEHLPDQEIRRNRIETLEIGIRLSTLTSLTEMNPSQLRDISEKAAKHCSDLLLNEDEELAPAVFLLAQCLHLSGLLELAQDDEALSILDRALPRVSAPLSALVEALTSRVTDAHQLLTIAKNLDAARNSEDIAFDFTNVAAAARRFLDTKSAAAEPQSTVVAIELLADHAIEGSSVGTSDSPFIRLETTPERAAEISREGLSVLFVGRSAMGRVGRVRVDDGGIKEVEFEEKDIFSIPEFELWAKRFPYGYGQSNDPNIFYTSTDRLVLTLSLDRPTVLVMDNSLQQLPPNLLRLNADFAGRLTPMATAPSLSWLWSARKSSKPCSQRRKAWIPTDAAHGTSGGLTILADRLQDLLEEYQIDLDRRSQLPDDLADSELAVIAAHGGILPEGRFIHRLSDESRLAIYPTTLATAVRQSSIVILFVCSGGRIDSHPAGETTVGLVKELLNNGCSTVIASPWPLSVLVPPHWLPVFLQEWMAGHPVMVATYSANQNVALKLGDNPFNCLAMNVFGDPLRTKS